MAARKKGEETRGVAQWFGVALAWLLETTLGHLVGYILAAGIGVAAIVSWSSTARAWLGEPIRLSVWHVVVALFALAISVLTAAIAVWKLSQRGKDFQPIRVVDERLRLQWRLTVDPKTWLDIDLARCSPDYVSSMIDGPFHDIVGCFERLRSVDDGIECVPRVCICCEQRVWDGEVERADIPFLKKHALGDLQRLHRQGAKIRNNVKLTSPVYWIAVNAPKATKRRSDQR